MSDNIHNEKTPQQLWKEHNISYAEFTFACGGDSMNDTEILLYNKDDRPVECEELQDYFDSDVYNHVEFYVNSDGHYLGESGTVEIRLDEEGEDFTYSKSSTSEWEESITSEVSVELDEEELSFVKDNVLNINGEEGRCVVNYKRDFIMTDRDEEIEKSIQNKVFESLRDFEPDTEYDVQDYYTFFTNEDGKDIVLSGNKMGMTINNRVIEFRED